MDLFKKFTLIGLCLILFSSCAKIFYTPDARSLAQNQSTIAIVPPTISIAGSRNMFAEVMKEQQRTESLSIQREMYAWILKRKMKDNFAQEIQDIETTNAKLKEAGYPEKTMTTAELCDALGVDGILTSNFQFVKPMSEAAAVALIFLEGDWGDTNEVHVSLSISDCSNKKLIWNYDHKISSTLGSSPARMVDRLMRKASRKMPYRN